MCFTISRYDVSINRTKRVVDYISKQKQSKMITFLKTTVLVLKRGLIGYYIYICKYMYTFVTATLGLVK